VSAPNFALIRELEGDAVLQAWLGEFGLTPAEAGRIQPSYCFYTRAENCFCNDHVEGYTWTAVLEGTLVKRSNDGEFTSTPRTGVEPAPQGPRP
jgi:hypothetical protein